MQAILRRAVRVKAREIPGPALPLSNARALELARRANPATTQAAGVYAPDDEAFYLAANAPEGIQLHVMGQDW